MPEYIKLPKVNDLHGISQKVRVSKFVLYDPVEMSIKITIQDGPIKEHGENGEQIDIFGEIWLAFIEQFNSKFPCRENEYAIKHIKEALMWQDARTKERTKRGVEGTNKC